MGACHLISLLVLLLSTGFSFSHASRLLREEFGCTYSAADDCSGSQTATGTVAPVVLGGSVCFPCLGTNMGGIVIGLPGISIPGLGIGLPTISIGTHGIQIGGYGGMVGYIPGLGYPLCCVPAGGGGRMGDPGSAQGQGGCMGSPQTPPYAQGSVFENEMKSQDPLKPKTEQAGNKGHEGDTHVVNPKMRMGKQSSVNNHGVDIHQEHKKVYTMPPMSD